MIDTMAGFKDSPRLRAYRHEAGDGSFTVVVKNAEGTVVLMIHPEEFGVIRGLTAAEVAVLPETEL